MSSTFRQDAKGFSYGLMWFLIILIVGILVSIGLWAFGVFSSGAKGAGDVIKDQNSASNREAWVAKYNGEYQKVQADKVNLPVLKKASEAKGASKQDKMDYTGAVQVCNQDVADYNAATQDLLGKKWLPAGLPDGLDAVSTCGSNVLN